MGTPAYMKEYNARPIQKKRRAARNAARRKLMEMGKVKRGDGKDVDHIRRNEKGKLSNSPSNLRVMSKSKNRARNGA